MARILKVISGFSGSEFYRNIAGLFSGIFVARLIPALFAILLARLYSPDNFGDFVLFLSFASLLTIIVNGGYEGAIILAETTIRKSRLFRFAIRTNFLINFLILVLIPVYIAITGEGRNYVKILLGLIPFYTFFFGGLQVIRNILISNKSFKNLAVLEMTRALLTGTFQLLFFIMPETGLFIGVTIAQALTFIFFIMRLPETSLNGIFRYSRCELALARRYKNFPLFSVPSEFFNYLSNQLPVFMFKPFFGLTNLGFYSFSHRYLNIPVQLTSISIGSVYIQKARSLKDEPGELSTLTFSLLRKQVWLAIVPFTILGLWGTEIFSIVFGNEWSYSGTLARILAPWLFAVFVSSPLSTILIAKEKQKNGMIFNILLLIFRFMALVTGGLILKDMTWATGLFSLTGFLFFTGLGIYSLHLAGVNLLQVLFFLLKAMVICVSPLILFWLWL